MSNKEQTAKRDVLYKAFLFTATATAMFLLTFNIDLLSHSGDSAETWMVAKTFFSKDKYYSYVMYKGIYAFIPCIIDIFLTSLFKISEQLIFKALNAIFMGYVAAVGIPNLVGHIHGNKKVTLTQRVLLAAVLLILERDINYFVSVDMISCTLFIMLCNCVLSITEDLDKVKPLRYLYLGILFGLNICFSGQFTISAFIVLFAALIKIAYHLLKKADKETVKRVLSFVLAVIFIFIGTIAVKLPNNIYEAKVVNPAREAGEWIPTGTEWIVIGLSANLKMINYPKMLEDKLSLSTISPELQQKIINDEYPISSKLYIKTIINNPFKFLVRWSERLFLGVFNDPYNRIFYGVKFVSLNIIIMAFFVFALYDRFKDRFKTYKDIISVDMAVYLGFLFTALVPSFSHVENRYYFTIRCLVYGVFFISPYLNNCITSLKEKILNKKPFSIGYNLYGSIIFSVLSLVIYYAIYY